MTATAAGLVVGQGCMDDNLLAYSLSIEGLILLIEIAGGRAGTPFVSLYLVKMNDNFDVVLCFYALA